MYASQSNGEPRFTVLRYQSVLDQECPPERISALVKLSRSKAFVLQEGRCPENEQTCEFKISTQKINWLHKHGPDDKFYNLRNVPFAISRPTAIFRGLEREGHETSYCYVASPARRFVDDSNNVPVKDGYVFVVFISSNLEIFDWRFERSDGGGKLPENHQTRFTKLIWENKP